MPFGLSDKGFKRKRYADIRADLAAKWKEAFGENARTEEKSVNGIIISLIAYVASPVWMLAEKVYNSGFIHKASGQPLSGLVGNNLIRRRPAEKAEGYVKIMGDPGTIVDSGFKPSYKIEYTTTETVEIDDNGEVVAHVVADAAGVIGNAEAGEVNVIDTPLVGVSEVTNPDPISGGREEETDDELRKRYDLSLSAGGSPSTNGIRAEVLGVEGVRSASIIENLSYEEDGDGRPPLSYETYVLGGEDKGVANAIFKRRAAGTQPYGDITVDIEDDSGNIIPISFTRAQEVDVKIEIEIDKTNEYPQNGDDLIVTSIIEYIGGLNRDGNVYTGLQNGEDVYFTKIISLIHEINGVERVVKLNIGVDDGELTPMHDVKIKPTEVAVTNYESIDVL